MLPHWHLTQDKLFICILILFIALATFYSVVVPLFETPDEVWHYLYVKHIADGKGLPFYQEGELLPMRQEASQPPLLYLLCGWVTSWIDTSDVDVIVRYNPHAAIGTTAAWGNRNIITHTSRENFPYHGTVLAAHLARFLCVLMGAGTVWCTYAVTRRLFPTHKWLAPAVAALNAFIPQFLFINASVNNDVLVALLSAVSLWLLVCIVQDGPSFVRLSALGMVLGLAGLTKLNGLILLPLAALVLIALAWRRGVRWAWVRWGLWTVAVAVAVSGWWYVRNWLLYHDPFGLHVMFAVMPARTQRPTIAELWRLFNGVFKSFWGVFGWFNLVMEDGIYVVFAVGTVLAALGTAWLLYTRLVRRLWGELARVVLLLLWSAAFLIGLIGWSQASYPQGRMLFPAMPAIAILLMLGLAQWFSVRYTQAVAATLLIVLFCFAAIVPYRYIVPAYARAAFDEVERTAISYPFIKDFGEQVRLLGYDLSEQVVKAGTRLWVTLYWEALRTMDTDYSVFVHLVDDRGVTLAQRDSYPGAGTDPTRDWKVGQARRDLYPLDVPATWLAQSPFRIRVGLYNYATGQRLPVDFWNGRLIDFIELPVELGLAGGSATEFTELYLEFGGQIALTGYHAEPIIASPGDTLQVVLRWQALKTLDTDYTVFVHLMRTGAQIWGQNDHVPRNEQSPTSTWVAGQVVTDAFELHISPDAPEDSYQLIVGLYESATIRRLELPNGVNFVVLGQIEVKLR